MRDIGLTIDTLPVISLGIGLGVDYGIYVVARIQDEVMRGVSVEDAIITGISATGAAVFSTFSVMVGGIVPWAFSPLLFHNQMSVLLTFLMFTNMFAGVLVLPAFIAWSRSGFICKYEDQAAKQAPSRDSSRRAEAPRNVIGNPRLRRAAQPGIFLSWCLTNMNRRRLWKAGAGLALACLLASAADGAGARPGSGQIRRQVSQTSSSWRCPRFTIRWPACWATAWTRFVARFQVLTPIDRCRRDIVARDACKHNCAAEQAAFAIDLDTGAAAAASLTQGKYMDIYSKSTTSYDDLPPGLRRWISSRTSQSTSFKKMQFRFFK